MRIWLVARQLPGNLRSCRFASSHTGARGSGNARPFSKILIANRGEIACRVIRTARKMGIETVAVYSDPDRHSLHVDMADEAYRIGPASTNESYLKQEKILEVAKKSGAQAVHPGYGFLSQNPEFAQLLSDNGIVFIGPSPQAILDMGIKSTSKALMEKAGVPIISGYHGDDQKPERLQAEARKVGYPVMIKAFRGGGGKGMRIAMNDAEFMSQLESAKREAMKSFGDDAMLVEKYVQRPRHVEVQVFGDNYGDCVYLFERDCSVQRRHQKIIEEAPAPGLSWETRRSIGEAAVKAAKAVSYSGAGTVEFIMDSTKHDFYFMEMNTRLQVEHPVTEMITGTDLVAWQLKVAAGERLPKTQEELTLRGHSFEARIYAENPEENFMPAAGPLTYLNIDFDPVIFDGTVRVESGVRQGDEVSVHYDPMIAKLVVWDEDRVSALRKLDQLLRKYHISGLSTNIKFLSSLCQNADFQAGIVHTDFIPEHMKELFPAKTDPTAETLVEAAISLHFLRLESHNKTAPPNAYSSDPWNTEANWRVNHPFTENLKLLQSGKEFEVTFSSGTESGHYELKVGGRTFKVQAEPTQKDDGFEMEVIVDGRTSRFRAIRDDQSVTLFRQDGAISFEIPEFKYESLLSAGESSSGEAHAPMPGVIEKILVNPGQEVKMGDPLVIMIAMKMEYVIRAPRAGIVQKLPFKVGDNVKKNAQLVLFQHE